MREFILNSNWFEIAGAGIAFFGGIYLLIGFFHLVIVYQLLPALHIGCKLDSRPITLEQLKQELLLSASSIVIFGVGVIAPWALLQLGWAELALHSSLLQIVIELLVLLVWCEVYFYGVHWLLHRPQLQRFHMEHHFGGISTPWSAFAFHPVEAVMLGGVIVLPMLVHDFSACSLLAVPVLSLLYSNIKHANYDWKLMANNFFHRAAHRHHLHHHNTQGNYGFMFSFMDRLFKTRLSSTPVNKSLGHWWV